MALRFVRMLLVADLMLLVSGTNCSGTTAKEILHGWDLTGQTHVITGADRGIGYATALALASANATLVLGCRDTFGTGAVAAANITRITGNPRIAVLKLDLSSFQSVRSFAAEVRRHAVQIDGLICNAGIANDPASISAHTSDGFDMVFQVNYLGHFLLVEELMPSLRSSHGRIVLVSSDASFEACKWGMLESDCTSVDKLPQAAVAHTFVGNNTLGAPSSNYGLTKYLQVFHAAELARREGNVIAFSLHPGIVKSAMLDSLPATTVKSWCFGKRHCPLSVDEGAATSTYLAAAGISKVVSASGRFFDTCQPAKSVRSLMVLKMGEKDTLSYQGAVYNLSLHWISQLTNEVVV